MHQGIEENRHIVIIAASPAFAMNVLAATWREAQALAEMLYEARPGWRYSVDGIQAVFSREGKLVEPYAPT